MSQMFIQEEWPKILKDWHIVVAVFYAKEENTSLKMLRLIRQEFEPTLKDFPDTAVIKVPVQDNQGLVEDLSVHETPTLMVFHNGEIVKHVLKHPASSQLIGDRVVTPYKTLGKDLFDLVADLHRLAKK